MSKFLTQDKCPRSAPRQVSAWGILGMLLILCVPVAPAAAQGTDRIQRRNGVDSGEITAVTPLGITISKSGVITTIPTEEIRSVRYAGEPNELNAARVAAEGGRHRVALRAAEELAGERIRRPEIQADVQFLFASNKAALALAGQEPLDDALAAVRSFLSEQRSSYHVPAAIELYGDLLLHARQFDAARTEYEKLAKAKTSYFELRSALLLARAWQAEGKHPEAITEFDKLANSRELGPLIDPLRREAVLAREISRAATGDARQSVERIGQIIAKADEQDEELLAGCYNALGQIYDRAGDPRGALYAYLHVDLLFDGQRDAHAQALSQLIDLWKTVGRADRASDAADRFNDKYSESPWASER